MFGDTVRWIERSKVGLNPPDLKLVRCKCEQPHELRCVFELKVCNEIELRL